MGDNHVRALPPLEAFEKRYTPEPNSGCWLWEGSVFNHGYGQFSSKYTGKKWTTTAHRASWILHKGPIPDGLVVCHKCDVPLCVNPDHLFLGTNADNTHDAMRKGRHQTKANPFYRVGSERWNAKLNDDKVRAIHIMHEVGMSDALIAVEFGVTDRAIGHVVKGRSWAHVV